MHEAKKRRQRFDLQIPWFIDYGDPMRRPVTIIFHQLSARLPSRQIGGFLFRVVSEQTLEMFPKGVDNLKEMVSYDDTPSCISDFLRF